MYRQAGQDIQARKVAIARRADLGFLPVQDEQYDFVVPKSRADRRGVVAFKALLLEPRIREALARLGMKA